MRKHRGRKGFSLIEILLVAIVIGISLALIIPRAWRATVDSKYNLVRQTASELASATTAWAENQLKSQATATLDQYFDSLDQLYTGADGANNWNGRAGLASLPVSGVTPTTDVAATLPADQVPINPIQWGFIFCQFQQRNLFDARSVILRQTGGRGL